MSISKIGICVMPCLANMTATLDISNLIPSLNLCLNKMEPKGML